MNVDASGYRTQLRPGDRVQFVSRHDLNRLNLDGNVEAPSPKVLVSIEGDRALVRFEADNPAEFEFDISEVEAAA